MDSERSQVKVLTGQSPSMGEYLLVVLVLLLESGAFSTLTVTQGEIANQTGGSFVWQIFWVLVYLTTLGLLYRHCPGFLRQFFQAWPLIALVTLGILSTLWSDDPALTFRRGVLLSFSMVFGFYLARRFSLKEQLHLLAWLCGICIFFSIPFGLLHLGATPDFYPNAWHGIFSQKNDLGKMMALSAVVFLVLGKAEANVRWRTRVGLLAALILLVLSHSATALVLTVLMFVFFWLSGTLRKSFGKAVAGMALLTLGGMGALYWAVTHLATFTGALGRGVTMSGRLQLWALCIVMALRKPWLGYGYNAFWLGMHGPSWRIWQALGVPIVHAHDVFIQVWLDLGLVGLGLLLLTFTVYTIRGILLVRRTTPPEAVWPLMILVFYFLYSVTEITIISGSPVFTMVFSSGLFSTYLLVPAISAERVLSSRTVRRQAVAHRRMGPAAGAEGV